MEPALANVRRFLWLLPAQVMKVVFTITRPKLISPNAFLYGTPHAKPRLKPLEIDPVFSFTSNPDR
jgi:hypothetical protein